MMGLNKDHQLARRWPPPSSPPISVGRSRRQPPNALFAIRISSLPSAGSLRLDSRSIAVVGVVNIAELTQGKAASRRPTQMAAPASFAVQVRDDGRVANGGVDLDPTITDDPVSMSARSTIHHTLSGPGGGQIVRPAKASGPLVEPRRRRNRRHPIGSVRAYSTNQAVLPDSAIQLSALAPSAPHGAGRLHRRSGDPPIVIEVSDGSER